MKLVKKILHRLDGLYYPQEYLCFDPGSFEQPLHVYLVNGEQVIKDITNLHSLVGYSPLIISLPSVLSSIKLPPMIDLLFAQRQLEPNDSFTQKDALAWLRLKKLDEQQAGNERVYYYEGVKGNHRFLSSFHKWIMELNNRMYNKKPGNVFLPGNLYKQVQIAYSIPRNISLITLGEKGRYNLFPTDLHGPINEKHYIISLRQEGKACRQVMDCVRILLTTVESGFYKTVYGLGRNHMQEMKEKEIFPFDNKTSTNLQLPLPSFAVSYRELELEQSFTKGIHRVMLFRILFREEFTGLSGSLAHIHNTYASWRQKQGLQGNYLLR